MRSLFAHASRTGGLFGRVSQTSGNSASGHHALILDLGDKGPLRRHCERSKAIQACRTERLTWIATPLRGSR